MKLLVSALSGLFAGRDWRDSLTCASADDGTFDRTCGCIAALTILGAELFSFALLFRGGASLWSVAVLTGGCTAQMFFALLPGAEGVPFLAVPPAGRRKVWIFPALALILLFPGKESWKRKGAYALAGLLIFGAVLAPWMIRNARLGAGYTLDTNTGAVCHQNGAMLLAEVNNTDFETEKTQLLAEQKELFSDTTRFPDEAAREAWRLRRYRGMILDHPLVWLRQSASWRIFIPDAPTFWELCGFTSPNRGTMGVMAKYGFFSGVRHYFRGNWKLLAITILLILPTLLLYACALGRFVCGICTIKTRWYELLAFLAFAEYYLLLPGAITAPRYQIPALPILCVMAAAFLLPERSAKKPDAKEGSK